VTLPLLLSVPHAGQRIPTEMRDLCILGEEDIRRDSDEGAAEIYLPLRKRVAALITTDVARAIVDMNRGETDRRRDGIIKTHTCWDVPIYRRPPSEKRIRELIRRYHRPYHLGLSHHAAGKKLGLDCHTMAAVGPPVGPDPGQKRPRICISNADGTCPQDWIRSLAGYLAEAFGGEIALNHPFRGGYIIRSHAGELPWVQLEFSREDFLVAEEKGVRLLEALETWCSHQR
jgi:N-formylglutamate deformylase